MDLLVYLALETAVYINCWDRHHFEQMIQRISSLIQSYYTDIKKDNGPAVSYVFAAMDEMEDPRQMLK